MTIESSIDSTMYDSRNEEVQITIKKEDLYYIISCVSDSMAKWSEMRSLAKDTENYHVTVEGCEAVFNNRLELYQKMNTLYKELKAE